MSANNGTASKLPFDSVEVMLDTGTKTMTPAEFLALPLPQRITCVIQDRARFKDGPRNVDARTALAELRRLRVSA
jgi:hypothetical protein